MKRYFGNPNPSWLDFLRLIFEYKTRLQQINNLRNDNKLFLNQIKSKMAYLLHFGESLNIQCIFLNSKLNHFQDSTRTKRPWRDLYLWPVMLSIWLNKRNFNRAVVAELVRALYSLELYTILKVEGSNPGNTGQERINSRLYEY